MVHRGVARAEIFLWMDVGFHYGEGQVSFTMCVSGRHLIQRRSSVVKTLKTKTPFRCLATVHRTRDDYRTKTSKQKLMISAGFDECWLGIENTGGGSLSVGSRRHSPGRGSAEAF